MYAIIMAGGTGTRFWPLSRRGRPKQLLRIFGDKPMVGMALQRLDGVVPRAHVVVVTGAEWREAVAEALPDLSPSQLLAEPVGRNTAPCIGLATHLIQAMDGDDPVIGVFAADHFVADVPAFRDEVRLAYATAAHTDGIVVLGVRPTRPETGYGYLHVGPERDGVRDVRRFVEKPDVDEALGYLHSGDYLWNAGLFFFRASVMSRELQRQLPELAAGLARIAPSLGTDEADDAVRRHFPALPSVSIDYGVMENAPVVKAVVCTSGWSDVGHWAALPEVLGVDQQGNVARGDVVALDSSGNVLVNEASGRLLAAVGVQDLVVVQTETATLVLPREHSQRVKDVVHYLETKGRDSEL